MCGVRKGNIWVAREEIYTVLPSKDHRHYHCDALVLFAVSLSRML